MPTAQAETRIARPSAEVFALLEDSRRAPEWLESCISLEATSGGAKAVGTPLDYRFREGGRTGRMTGSVTSYLPGRALAMRFSDRRFTVEVSFALEQTGTSTRVQHAIAIAPATLMGKLLSPLIQLGNRRQVSANLERLKRLVEVT